MGDGADDAERRADNEREEEGTVSEGTKAALRAAITQATGEAPPKSWTKERLQERLEQLAAERAGKPQDGSDAAEPVATTGGKQPEEAHERASERVGGQPAQQHKGPPASDGTDAENAPAEPLTVEDVEATEAALVLARREPAPAPTALPSVKEWEASMAMAESICRTDFVPSNYRGKPDQVLAAILAGRELGVGPMQSLRDINIIDGRPVIAAHLLLAMLRRGGISILESESDDQHAMIRARRRDTGEEATIRWTYEDAAKVRSKNGKVLVDKDNWRNYPADMLWARCVGRLTRRLGSDLVAGMPYTAEEVADFDLDNADGSYKPYERGTLRDTQRQENDPVPRNWPEINEWAAAYGDPFGWPVWLQQATVVLFGNEKGEDKTKLTAKDREVLGQRAASVIYALRKQFDPGALPPMTRDDVQKAWAKVLEGAVLPGPEWAFDALDADLPTYWEANDLPEPTVPAAAPLTDQPETIEGEATDADDIDFGADAPYSGEYGG